MDATLEHEAQTVEIDGALYDAETGEFVRFAESTAPFFVTDQAGAEWVLRKMLLAEARLAAIELSPEVIAARAVLENAAKMKREAQARLDGLHRRFDADLGDFARRELEGSRSKTLKTLCGSISIKVVKGGLRVADQAAAVAWAKQNAPDAVKTTVDEKFLISALTAEQRLAACEDAWMEAAFEVLPDREAVTVKTGVAVVE